MYIYSEKSWPFNTHKRDKRQNECNNVYLGKVFLHITIFVTDVPDFLSLIFNTVIFNE